MAADALWNDYLVTNNGDGTLTAEHRHHAAKDRVNVYFLDGDGLRMFPLGNDQFELFDIARGHKFGTLTAPAQLHALDRREFDHDRRNALLA